MKNKTLAKLKNIKNALHYTALIQQNVVNLIKIFIIGKLGKLIHFYTALECHGASLSPPNVNIAICFNP